MTKKLSDAFFGDKKFTQKIYDQLTTNGEINQQDIQLIFQPYTSKLKSIQHANNGVGLFDIFVEFIQGCVQQFKQWQFQKLSSIVQISAHVFEYSFEHWLTRQQSFRYFSDVLVRHSLFRPPHSVCIFNYDELNLLTSWWLVHFDRYYDEYQKCMGSSLNQILICSSLPSDGFIEQSLSEGRQFDKSEFTKLLQ